MEQEIWRDVIGYEGLYQVSNLGRVKDLCKKIITKGKKDADGYMKISIKSKSYFIHRLVAQAFLPNYDNHPVINHKDWIKSNNRVDNLEWCSISYNNKYRNPIKRKKDYKDIFENLSKNIKLFRKKFNLTQQEVADILHTQRNAITYLEQGKRTLDLVEAILLVDYVFSQDE